MASTLRRPLIAGNWKMHLTLAESVALAKAIRDAAPSSPCETALFVPFTAVTVVAEVLKGSSVRLGGQNMHWEKQGAFTGEISAAQLKDAGCGMVLLGHSERRRLFGDTDEGIAKKLKAALEGGLTPVVCVGETLDERETQKTFQVLKRQLENGTKGFGPAELARIVIAYEPVWAIGTGKTATPTQAQDAHLFIRKTMAGLFGEGLAAGLRILYGGSVKPDNIDELMSQPDLDGALVGGESLKADGFKRIMNFKTTEISGKK